MPKLNQKKVITLKAKITRELTKSIEVNPSIRLTAVQVEVDKWVEELSMLIENAGCTVEVTAEGLV